MVICIELSRSPRAIYHSFYGNDVSWSYIMIILQHILVFLIYNSKCLDVISFQLQTLFCLLKVKENDSGMLPHCQPTSWNHLARHCLPCFVDHKSVVLQSTLCQTDLETVSVAWGFIKVESRLLWVHSWSGSLNYRECQTLTVLGIVTDS